MPVEVIKLDPRQSINQPDVSQNRYNMLYKSKVNEMGKVKDRGEEMGKGRESLLISSRVSCRQAEGHTSVPESGSAVKFSKLRFSFVTKWSISCCGLSDVCLSLSLVSTDLSDPLFFFFLTISMKHTVIC